jgi:hypothetical protein
MSLFGFIPPELLYKCDSFVRAFHDTRGSGKAFVAASAMFSAESPYLTRLVHNAVAIWKLANFLLAVSGIGFIISVLTSWWLLAVVVPMAASTLYLYRLLKTPLIKQSAIILAVEALASDFAGWGQLFPVARLRAETMFARDAGDWPKLVELYLPRERRTDADFVRMFAPSEGSVASALSTV